MDPALRRPGRLDREIEISAPSSEDRHAILRALLSRLRVYITEQSNGQSEHREESKGQRCLSSQDVRDIAQLAHGMVAADLLIMCKEAIHIYGQRRKSGGEDDQEESTLLAKMSNLRLHDDDSSQDNSLLLRLAPSDLRCALSRTTPTALRYNYVA